MKPEWLKVRLPGGPEYTRIKGLTSRLKLATVCEQARCPNIGECWEGGTSTIMLMGEVCTRGCRFCNVKTGRPKTAPNQDEPRNVAEAVAQMGLDYVVLTSVNRDDLEDDGSGHFAETVKYLKKCAPRLHIEVLTPDFRGKHACIQKIIQAAPDVFAHNIETVERLTPKVRDPRASYKQSLEVLRQVKEESSKIFTKTSIMLGLGESDEEIMQTLKDLRENACDIVTFGQYLRPQARHLPVQKYFTPKEFDAWKEQALSMGFLYVASGPLVRSSYRAGEYFKQGILNKGVRKPDSLLKKADTSININSN